MKNFILVVGMMFLLAACGGRVAKPINKSNSFDKKLSCNHLLGEAKNNQFRVFELSGGKSSQFRDNALLTASTLIVLPSILFIDLSPAQKEEMNAIYERNKVLLSLLEAKNCGEVSLPTSKDEFKAMVKAAKESAKN